MKRNPLRTLLRAALHINQRGLVPQAISADVAFGRKPMLNPLDILSDAMHRFLVSEE